MLCQLLYYDKTKIGFHTSCWNERSGNDTIHSTTEEVMIKWVP